MGNSKYDEMSKLVATIREKNGIEVACSCLNDGILKAPNILEAYLVRGKLYMEIGDIQKASDDFEKAIEINPNEPESYFLRGSLYAMSDSDIDIYKAISDFSKTIALDANHSGVYTKLENIYMRAKENYKVQTSEPKYDNVTKQSTKKNVEKKTMSCPCYDSSSGGCNLPLVSPSYSHKEDLCRGSGWRTCFYYNRAGSSVIDWYRVDNGN